jgi:ketosteroid isomerase-like protein
MGQQLVNYGPSPENPFGKINPEAPKETADYEDLIGLCDCISTTRNADQSWNKPQKMTWKWSYIMNGFAVQDETIKEDGNHSGSIRQFNADSSRWYVHWYSNTSPSAKFPTWEGGKRGDSIVLYNEQKAPNGVDGYFRITFSEISESGFEWLGEWVNLPETFSFPTWKISCKKRLPATDKAIILKNTKAFSEAYMNADAEAISRFYTEDAKIFPGNSDIISGRQAIKERWKFAEGVKDLYHKVTPSEINIIDKYAYDYGYYEGSLTTKKGKVNPFKGKYVIVWKKVDTDWKIYLDIWNSL